MRAHRAWPFAALALPLFCLLAATPARAERIDISALANEPLDPAFFAQQGVIFTSPLSVGFVQGDDVLLGRVTGRFTRPVTRLSVLVAPAFQGTALYTLALFGPSSVLIGSTSVQITQDLGDPQHTEFGYVALTAHSTTQPARSFSLSNQFVRSSFPHITHIDFGVSSFDLKPVPEPGSLLLLLGGAGLLWRRIR